MSNTTTEPITKTRRTRGPTSPAKIEMNALTAIVAELTNVPRESRSRVLKSACTMAEIDIAQLKLDIP